MYVCVHAKKGKERKKLITLLLDFQNFKVAVFVYTRAPKNTFVYILAETKTTFIWFTDVIYCRRTNYETEKESRRGKRKTI